MVTFHCRYNRYIVHVVFDGYGSVCLVISLSRMIDSLKAKGGAALRDGRHPPGRGSGGGN